MMQFTSYWRNFFFINFLVLFIIATAKLLLNANDKLLLAAGIIYLFCFLSFFLLSLIFRKPSLFISAYLPLSWLFLMILFFGGVYKIDRAGWNWFRLTGYDVTWSEMIPLKVDLPLTEFIRSQHIFTIDQQDPSRLVIRADSYDINQTLVIPRGSVLIIEPGTTLRFRAGRSLISYRAIIARGTEAEPIVFTAQNPRLKWGAVGIVRAEKSVFDNVVFEHGRRARVNNIDFFGSLTAVDSEVEILNCRFDNLFGKDGVNLRNCRVLVRNNIFRDIFKDGIDLDGGEGFVTGNEFYNCGDEAIDLSENKYLQVIKNTIYDLRGGSISADYKQSEIEANNVYGLINSSNTKRSNDYEIRNKKKKDEDTIHYTSISTS